MFKHPMAPFSAGSTVRFRAAAISLTVGAIAMLGSVAPSSAESAADVIKKMADVYNKAKSFQATITVIRKGKTAKNEEFSITQIEKVQFQTPNLFRKSVRISGTGAAGSGQGAAQLKNSEGDAYSDGKKATTYVPALKKYRKQAIPPNVQIAQLFSILQQIPAGDTPGLSLLPEPATFQGRAAYVIELKPQAKPGLTTEQKKQFDTLLKTIKKNPRFLIDKQNYTLLQASQSSQAGSVQVDITDQKINAAIPASAFNFTPPAGSQEVINPPTQPGAPAPGGK